jgi:NADH-quinone oxidoreductase subunit J
MMNILAAGSGGTNADSVAVETVNAILWVLALGGAVGLVLMRRAVHCAMMLAVVMLSLSVMYAMQGAPFLAFVQVIVYTGAVLMLFLFVLMLIGVRSQESLTETIRGQRLWALLAGFALAVLLALGIGHAAIGPAQPMSPQYGASNLTGIATLIFTTYVFPFEVTSALLLAAALGAMVLAHRERIGPKQTQLDLARRRIASGNLAPEPPPGVYALHDAVDMPAMLPDGSTSARSVSQAISRRDLDLGRDTGPSVSADLEKNKQIEAERAVEAAAGGRDDK